MKNKIDVATIRNLSAGPMTPTAKDEESIAKRWQELSRFGVVRPSQRGIKVDLEEGKRVLVQRGMPVPYVRTADGSDKSIIEFFAATGGKKRDGNYVDNTGWKFNSFVDNPIFLWCHDYAGLPLGHHVAWGVDKNNNQPVLRTAVKFASRDVYPFADTVRKLYLNRDLRTVSAGWIPLKWREMKDGGILFEENELLEVSGCPIPADPTALMQAAQRGIISSEELENCARWLPALALARDVAYVMSNIRVVGSDAPDATPTKDEDPNAPDPTDEPVEGDKNDEGSTSAEDSDLTDDGAAEEGDAGDAGDSGASEGTDAGEGTPDPEKAPDAAPGAQGGGDAPAMGTQGYTPTPPAEAGRSAGRDAGRDGAVVSRSVFTSSLQPNQVRGVLSDKMDVAFDKICGPAILLNDVLYEIRNNINSGYWNEGDGFEVRPQGLRRAINRLNSLIEQVSEAVSELDDACAMAEQSDAPEASETEGETRSLKKVKRKVQSAQAKARLAEIENLQTTIAEMQERMRALAVDIGGELDPEPTPPAIDPSIEKLRTEMRSVAQSFAKGETPATEGVQGTSMADVLAEMRKWSSEPKPSK